MRLLIKHSTHYQYESPVKYALQQLRLTPKSRAGQTVHRWRTVIDGGRKELEFEDQHHNVVTLISFESGRQNINVSCEGEVETSDQSGIIGEHGGFAPIWYFKRETTLTRAGTQVQSLVEALDSDFENDVARMHDLSTRITESVTYETGKTDALTSAEGVLQAGAGVCQDHAHVFISAARHMGFPARYVSGYLMLNERVNQDASHAWAEAHIDGIGWVGFDASNGISPDERYVRVATGLDYNEAAPISGMRYGHGDESMSVSVQVQQQ